MQSQISKCGPIRKEWACSFSDLNVKKYVKIQNWNLVELSHHLKKQTQCLQNMYKHSVSKPQCLINASSNFVSRSETFDIQK